MIYSITELKEINEKKISKLHEKGEESKELAIQLCIQKILDQELCFLQMTIETAFSILEKLIEKSDIEETYKNLISAKNFKRYKL